jgi:hypothetical protein
MKTTLEIPDALLHLARSAAAKQGIPFRKLVSDALAETLRVHPRKDKLWLKSFGKLRSLRKESANIKRIIEQEFGQTPNHHPRPPQSPNSSTT